MNAQYLKICQILNEMSSAAAIGGAAKKIIKRMPTGLKIFTVAPIPVIPNSAMGIGYQFATDPRSRKIAAASGHVIKGNIKKGLANISNKVSGWFRNKKPVISNPSEQIPISIKNRVR